MVFVWENRIIPVAVEVVRAQGDAGHLPGCGFHRLGILVRVQNTSHLEAGLGFRGGNEADDGGMREQRLALPVLRDEGEESMLDLVPLARSGWKMADGNGQSRLIGELLQFPLPQAETGSVTAAAVGGDEQ